MRDKVTPRKFRSLLGKPVFAAAIFAAMGFFASPASAACISGGTVYCDNTVVAAFKGSSYLSTYTNNGFVSGVGDVLQSSGNSFNTDKLIATLTEHRGNTTLELKYYTSFNGSSLGAHYADIFLGSNPSSPDNFGYAISLGNQASNGGFATSGFYQVTGATEKTSVNIWSSKSGTYGGAFLGTDNVWNYSPVVVTTAATKNNKFTSSVVETTTSADPGFGYLVDVKLVASNTDFNALFGGGLSVFWGTADCSNDAIQALIAFTPVHVPEPLTLSLFSAGIAGIAAMRLRRKTKAA